MPYVKGGHNDKIFPWKKREGYPNPKDIVTQTNPKNLQQGGARPETTLQCGRLETKETQTYPTPTDPKPKTMTTHTQTDKEDYNTQIETNPSSVNVQRVNPNAEDAATQTKAKNQDLKTMPTLKHAYGKNNSKYNM